MKLAWPWLLALVTVGGACAHGSKFADVGGAGGGSGLGGGTGSASATGSAVTTSTQVGVTTAISGVGGSGSQATTDTASSSSDTATATSSTGGPAPCNTAPSNSCGAPTSLPDVSGDQGGQASASGSGSQWIAVHVTETNSSIIPAGLSYTVTLTSPPGMVYHLSVREGSNGGGPNCQAGALNGLPANGSVQTVHDSWSDHLGSDDSKWLDIFVELQSGTDCNAQWSLNVVGNT